MSRKFGRRLVAGAVLPLVLALIVQAAYTISSERTITDAGLGNKARALAALTVNLVGPSIVFDDDKAVAEGLGYAAADRELAFAATVDPAGRIGSLRGDPTVRDLLHPVEREIVLSIGPYVAAAAPVISDGRQVATVYIGLRGEDVWTQLTDMSERAAAISLAGIALAVIVVQLLARRIVRGATQMRLVLDTVDEALAMVRRDGTLSAECSTAFARWFGAPAALPFWEQLASGDDAAMLALAWQQLQEDVLPRELLVEQFPSRLARDGRHFRLFVVPAGDGALLRIADVTAEVEAQAQATAQRDYAALIERLIADPDGARALLAEGDALIANLDPRNLHTLKGNAGLFGMTGLAALAHRAEDRLAETGVLDARELIQRWRDLSARAAVHRGATRDAEHVAVRLAALRAMVPPAIDVAIDPADLRVPTEPLRSFWAALAHVVRNAIDHGIEPADERVAAGKPPRGRIELRAARDGDRLVVEIADDGRGIDWDRLAARAREIGVATDDALFADGVSTAAIGETSGRGIGLAAVRATIAQLGGELRVASQRGQGTRWVFRMEVG